MSRNKHKDIIWKLCSNYTILINVSGNCFGFNKPFYHLSCKQKREKTNLLFILREGIKWPESPLQKIRKKKNSIMKKRENGIMG